MSNPEDTIEQDGASNGDSEADFQVPRTHVDRYERIELPPFWSQQAQLWFAAVEAQFQLRRITSDATKYYTVIARLDQDALIVVENLITNPPTNDKYSTLKNALLNHFALSQSRRFKMLLSGLELGDRRPSELLAEINRLGGDKLDPAFVRVIWLERLPPQVQMALVGRDQEDNVQLSQLANHVMEVQRNANYQNLMPVSRNVSTNALQQQVDKLAEQLEKLILERSNNNSSGASNPLPNASYSTPLVCFYHRRFGARANKCTKPCAFVEGKGNASSRQ